MAALLVSLFAIYQVVTINSLDAGHSRQVEVDTTSLSEVIDESSQQESEEKEPEDSFEMEDQYSENYRLLAQRDIQKLAASNFKKPSNYRGEFVCELTYAANKLKDIDCGNDVYNRFAFLALEKTGLEEFSTPLTTTYTVEVRF